MKSNRSILALCLALPCGSVAFGGLPQEPAQIAQPVPFLGSLPVIRHDTAIGVVVGPVDPALARHLGIDAAGGILVNDVLPGRAAAKAGLQRYDVIVAIDGDPVTAGDALRAALDRKSEGDVLELKLRRADLELKKSVTVEARPNEGASSLPGLAEKIHAEVARRALEAGSMAHLGAEPDAQHAAELAARLKSAKGADREALLAEVEHARAMREIAKHSSEAALGDALAENIARLEGARELAAQRSAEVRAQLEQELAKHAELFRRNFSDADRLRVEELMRASAERYRASLDELRERVTLPELFAHQGRIAIGNETIDFAQRLSERHSELDARFEAIDARLARIEAKLDQMLAARDD
jgi:hypothetical protein